MDFSGSGGYRGGGGEVLRLQKICDGRIFAVAGGGRE